MKKAQQYIETRCAKCKEPKDLADLQYADSRGYLICESCYKAMKKKKEKK